MTLPKSLPNLAQYQGLLAEQLNPILAGKIAQSITASTTVDSRAAIVLVNATAGAVTVTLPIAAVSTGREIVVKKTDASANAVTIDGNGAETIDGAANTALATQWKSKLLYCTGAAWMIVADF